VLVFLHIQKTAGTTLRIILQRLYGEQGVFRTYRFGGGPAEIAGGFLKEPAEIRDQKQIMIGHMMYGVHEHFDYNVEYFTVLRNPVDRVVSLYYYILQTPGYPIHDAIKRNKMSLLDFAASSLIYESDNGLIRYCVPDGFHLPHGGCTRDTLETAKANLRTMRAIGLTEDFDRSLVVMKNVFGWGHVPLYTKQNPTRGRRTMNEIDQDVLDAIGEINRYDVELYQYGQELYREQLRKQDPGLDDDVASYRESLAELHRIIAADDTEQKKQKGFPFRRPKAATQK
jgi:hypothetical protein